MTDRDRSSGLKRRAFLGGATSAGVTSLFAPRTVMAQASAPTASSAPDAAITTRTTEHLVGSAVNHAYAVKAGPFVFLNGHEGYDFAAGVVPAVAGAPGFPDYGKPGLRREADFIFERMGQILKSFGTDFAHSVRLDQYYTEANAVRAYHLARFAALRQIHPAQHLDDHRALLRRQEHHDDLARRGGAGPAMGGQRQSIPKDAAVSAYSGYAPAVVANDFVFAAGTGPDVKDVLDTDPPEGPHYLLGHRAADPAAGGIRLEEDREHAECGGDEPRPIASRRRSMSPARRTFRISSTSGTRTSAPRLPRSP